MDSFFNFIIFNYFHIYLYINNVLMIDINDLHLYVDTPLLTYNIINTL